MKNYINKHFLDGKNRPFSLLSPRYLQIALILSLSFLIAACGEDISMDEESSAAPSAALADVATSRAAVADFAHPFNKSLGCASCHNDSGLFSELDLLNGGFEEFRNRLIDQPLTISSGSNPRCVNELLIDSANIENSLLLKSVDQNIAPGDLCGGRLGKMPVGTNGLSAQKYNEVKDWIQYMLDTDAAMELDENAAPIVVEAPVAAPPKVAPVVVAPAAPKVVVAPKPKVVVPAIPKVVTPPKMVVAPKPKVVEPPKVVVAPKPKVVEPPKVVVAPKPKVVEPPKVVVAPKPKVVESPRMAGNPFEGKLAASCIGCHNVSSVGDKENLNLSGGVESFYALVNQKPIVSQANLANGSRSMCENELVIDRDNPENSLLLKIADKTIPNAELCIAKMPYYPGSTGLEAKDADAIKEWIYDVLDAFNADPDAIAALNVRTADEFVNPVVDGTLVPHGNETLIKKLKTALHGGAIVQKDLDILDLNNMNDVIDYQKIDALADEWMATDAFERRMMNFMGLALQQRGGIKLYAEQFGRRGLQGGNDNKVPQVMEEIMPRTALRMIRNNEDFRTIVTTNEWEMTSAGLYTLAYLDNQSVASITKQHYSRNLSEFSKRFPDAFKDWRTIKLVNSTPNSSGYVSSFSAEGLDALDRSNNSNTPYNGKNDALHSVGKNGASNVVKTARPAYGFMNSPSFFETWPTNVDNQFRVTVNQVLLTALGKTFSEADNTPLDSKVEVNGAHAAKNTNCFGCHKNLDPMRNAYMKHYSSHTMRPNVTQNNNEYRLVYVPQFSIRKSSPQRRLDHMLRNRIGGFRNNVAAVVNQGGFNRDGVFIERAPLVIFLDYLGKESTATIKDPDLIEEFQQKFADFRKRVTNDHGGDVEAAMTANKSMLSETGAGSTALIKRIATNVGHKVLTYPGLFAFDGHKGDANTMKDFAETIANHPYFARAWVLKVCQWINSTDCNVNHPEIQSELDMVEAAFKVDHNFKTLLKTLISSKLVTHTTWEDQSGVAAQTSEYVSSVPASTVSIARRHQFCDAMTSRIDQMQGRVAPEAKSRFCTENVEGRGRDDRALYSTSFFLSEATASRGQVNFDQTTNENFLINKNVKQVCDRIFDNQFGSTFSSRNSETKLDGDLSKMVQFMMGYRKSTQEYTDGLSLLHKVYKVGRAQKCGPSQQNEQSFDAMLAAPGDPTCGLNQDHANSLKMVYGFACRLPANSAIGM